ncbi:hypothetical protein DSECCO2_422070 [anaerobic digester metagenome]
MNEYSGLADAQFEAGVRPGAAGVFRQVGNIPDGRLQPGIGSFAKSARALVPEVVCTINTCLRLVLLQLEVKPGQHLRQDTGIRFQHEDVSGPQNLAGPGRTHVDVVADEIQQLRIEIGQHPRHLADLFAFDGAARWYAKLGNVRARLETGGSGVLPRRNQAPADEGDKDDADGGQWQAHHGEIEHAEGAHVRPGGAKS